MKNRKNGHASDLTPESLRAARKRLLLSQSKLEVLSDVSRQRIGFYELGYVTLNPDELGRIRTALQRAARELQEIAIGFESSAGAEARSSEVVA